VKALENRRDAKEACRKLKTNHYGWILAAAIKHFEAAVEALEQEIIRLERFKPHHARKVNDLSARRGEYLDILEALHALRDVFTDVAAEEFAQNFVNSMKKRSP
jgi:Mg2+ and Co2+ transporter CorA